MSMDKKKWDRAHASFDAWRKGRRFPEKKVTVKDITSPEVEALIEETQDRNEHDVKQVILIRRDLKMRRGKEIAQGSHASIAFLTNAVSQFNKRFDQWDRSPFVGTGETKNPPKLALSPAAWQWIDGQFTKVTLMVFSEEELLKYHEAAKAAGIPSHVIQDSGRTEFGGKPTYTACAIGPDYSEKIDKVTGDLRLY